MENKRENFNEEVSLEENSAKANNAEMAKKTILVVDDEKPIVDILTYNLQKEGYSTLEANDGEEAIKIATEKKPDLILLDIMLPKVDGLTVCKKLRHTLNVPILILRLIFLILYLYHNNKFCTSFFNHFCHIFEIILIRFCNRKDGITFVIPSPLLSSVR